MLACLIGLTGCELFGLDFQKPYDYNNQVGLSDNQVKMSGWSFINSRTDLFSSLIEAVQYAEVDTNLFNQPNQTLLPVINQGLNNATATNQSYWYMHQIPDPTDPTGVKTMMPLSWDVYPKQQIKDFILYHIVKGAWSYNEITKATQGSPTFFQTLSSSPKGYALLESKREGAMTIYFNNFTDHYKVNIVPRTSNLQLPNGSYIHVMNNYLDYPSDFDMTLYPIYK
jgi:hypothetical protein